MTYLTIEVKIEHGQIMAKEPEQLPENGTGLLTIVSIPNGEPRETTQTRKKVELPLIRGDGKRTINPTRDDLDASLWGD